MSDWSYQREESSLAVPVGKHLVRIKEVKKTQSKAGNDMLEITLQVSGMNNLLWHYIVFMPDRPEMTNRMLTQFFDAFPGIKEGDFVLANWVGKVGACVVAVDKNDDSRTRISYFIKADKAEELKQKGELKPWVEPENAGTSTRVPDGADGFVDMSNVGSDIPFM